MATRQVRRTLRLPPKGQVWVAIQQNHGPPTLWEVSSDAIEEVQALPPDAWPVLSFSEHDLRVVTNKPMPHHRAKSLVRQQCGQPCRIVNHSERGAVYGRSVALMPQDFPAVPAAALVDAMLNEREGGWPSYPFVVGFLLSAGEAHNEILALWAGTPRRDLSVVQATENATQAEQIISAFCAQNGVEALPGNIIMFDLAQLLAGVAAHASRLDALPNYDDWRGIPLTRMWGGAATVSASAAAITLAVATWLGISGMMLTHKREEATARATKARTTMIEMFLGNLGTAAQRSSIQHRKLTELARDIYAPGGTVSLLGGNNPITLRLTLPVMHGQMSSGPEAQLTSQTTKQSNFEYVVARDRGSKREARVAISAGGNEINYDYVVPADHARLLSYLDK